MKDIRRLFFGFEIEAPWPLEYPPSRLVAENHRHLTVVFLSTQSYPKVHSSLLLMPRIPLLVGLSGVFDRDLYLPENCPRVVSWHINWLDGSKTLEQYHDTLRQYFSVTEKRPLLPHVTICRAPFDRKAWEKAFQILPCIATAFHLYESVGNLAYESRWKQELQKPFVEKEHTADIAYTIYGENLRQIFLNAQVALAFRFPKLISYFSEFTPRSQQEIVFALNSVVTKADSEIGCPFKAVSYHGDIVQEGAILQWEMIVDV